MVLKEFSQHVFFLGIKKLVLGSGQVTKNSENLNSKSSYISSEVRWFGQWKVSVGASDHLSGCHRTASCSCNLQGGGWLLSNQLAPFCLLSKHLLRGP